MPVSGIAANGLSNFSAENNLQQELQQLGKDLKSGNLTAAQSDFVTLQNDLPQGSQPSSPQSNDPIAQAFQQLGEDLQSGDLSAAQSDFVTLQQDLSQTQGGRGTLTLAGSALPSQIQNSTPLTPQVAGNGSIPSQGNSTTSSQSNIAQAFQQLGKDLESGNLAAAQADFATLQKDLSQSSQGASQNNTLVTQASAQSAQGAEGAEGHHHKSGGSTESGQAGQLIAQLGQELQSGSLSNAQQTFNSLQQLQLFSQNGGQ